MSIATLFVFAFALIALTGAAPKHTEHLQHDDADLAKNLKSKHVVEITAIKGGKSKKNPVAIILANLPHSKRTDASDESASSSASDSKSSEETPELASLEKTASLNSPEELVFPDFLEVEHHHLPHHNNKNERELEVENKTEKSEKAESHEHKKKAEDAHKSGKTYKLSFSFNK